MKEKCFEARALERLIAQAEKTIRTFYGTFPAQKNTIFDVDRIAIEELRRAVDYAKRGERHVRS